MKWVILFLGLLALSACTTTNTATEKGIVVHKPETGMCIFSDRVVTTEADGEQESL